MNVIGGFFASQMWKIVTGAAGLLSVILALALFRAGFENRQLVRQVQQQERTINDPKTGLNARLAQSETNTTTVRDGLTQQNNALISQAAADTRQLLQTTQLLRAAQLENVKRALQIQQFLATPPQGKEAVDRYNDIDRRLLESLK